MAWGGNGFFSFVAHGFVLGNKRDFSDRFARFARIRTSSTVPNLVR